MLTKLELKRQLFHIFLGITIVILFYLNLINYIFLLILALTGLIFSFLSKKYDIPLIEKLLKTFDRKKDLETIPGKGAIFYILGCSLAILFFEKNIAMASIMILALGDSISRLVGPYGFLKHPFHNEKFLEGVIAGALAGGIGAVFFVYWPLAIIASSVSMLIEGIDLRIKGFNIDDNLMIPVVSGLVMLLLKIYVFF